MTNHKNDTLTADPRLKTKLMGFRSIGIEWASYNGEEGVCDLSWDLAIIYDSSGINSLEFRLKNIFGIELGREQLKPSEYKVIAPIDTVFIISPKKVWVDPIAKTIEIEL